MSIQRPLQRLQVTLFVLFALAQGALCANAGDNSLELRGAAVVPHIQSEEMRYRREPDRSLGAWVQLFLENCGSSPLSLSPQTPVRLRDKTPGELVTAGDWTWHDFPSAWTNAPLELPPGAMTVWSFNGRNAPWGAGTSADLDVGAGHLQCDFAKPRVWLSAVTFLGDATNPFPNSVIFHVANETSGQLRLEACRFWLPRDNRSWRVLLPQPWHTNLLCFPENGRIPAGDRGGARVQTGPLPLTYTALEIRLSDDAGRPFTLWCHLRIKREVFDISGGWVASGLHGSNTLQVEPYLKTLRRMHVNTGMHQEVAGYSDSPLFEKYPLKYMNRFQPFDHYDTEAILPRIHAVEFLGEPQYGGGRPVPPMEVWRAFAPYQATRLPTSVTHSEERLWRFYAGLSDYPHYDAYRVTAPSPDAWSKYDRWGGQTIRWGAPLETIGEMTRSLRELNRPRPIAYWSQGAHYDWDRYGGRRRTSPTPDEMRAQAYHALASRITSIYWFNLSLKSLVKYRDLIEPITRVNREVLLMAELLLEGNAFEYRRVLEVGQPSWVSPDKLRNWLAFLRNHRDALVGMDFFTVPTMSFGLLWVFVVLHHERRRVIHSVVTDHPEAPWIVQQLREAFPFDTAPRYAILDWDGKYGYSVPEALRSIGVKPVRPAPRSPWQNPYVERFGGTLRRELLDKIIVFNQKQLRRVMSQFVTYYHADGCHLGLAKDAPESRVITPQPSASAHVVALPRVGGLQHRYEWREAA